MRRAILKLFRRHRLEHDLELELAFHRDMAAAAGNSIPLGNTSALKEQARDLWQLFLIENLWRELRIASRVLRNNPGFTATVALTLALGIGANTAVFSVVDSALLRPLPYPAADQLGEVVMDYKSSGEEGTSVDVDGRTWELLRDQAGAVEGAVFSDMATEANFAASGHTGYIRQQRVSAGFFRVLGVTPVLGREFKRQEDVPGGARVAVLSYGVWRREFDRDPKILDRPILLRGEPYTVVGVMPPDFRTSTLAGIWTPLRPSTTGEGENTNYDLIARLKPGAKWEQAITEVQAVGIQRLHEARDLPPNVTFKMRLVPIQSVLASGLRTPVLLLWCAVSVVLLIGCVNVAGLLLARSVGRTREIGTRIALGGGRGRVIYQLLVESLVLALIGGAGGLALGWAGIAAFRAIAIEKFGLWQGIALDARVLGATAAVTLATSLLFGLWPALQASRIDIRSALAEAGGRGVAGGRSLWPRRLLITGEIALAVMLAVASGLLVRSFLYLRNQPGSFDPRNVVAGALPLQDARYQTSQAVNRLLMQALARLTSIPGVETAAAAMNLPYERGLNTMARVRGKASQNTVLTWITPDYFRILRIPVLRGRAFTEADGPQGRRVAIVNSTFARKYFGDVNPVGQSMDQGGAQIEIAGMVADVPLKGSMSGYEPVTAMPVVFVPVTQCSDSLLQLVHAWFTPSIMVRSPAPATVMEERMRHAMESVDPLLPFASFRRIAEIRSETLAQQRFQAAVMAILAGLAILLAAIGIYGLMAQSVRERTRELGIRLALGATVRQVVRSVAGQGLRLALFGCAIGAAAAAGAVPVLRHILWGVRPKDASTFAATVVLLLLVSAAACLIPTLRIARLNVAETLRNE